jgi:hypothetical protein
MNLILSKNPEKEKELKKKMAIYQKQMVKIPTVMTSDSHDPVTSSLYHGDRHCLEFTSKFSLYYLNTI